MSTINIAMQTLYKTAQLKEAFDKYEQASKEQINLLVQFIKAFAEEVRSKPNDTRYATVLKKAEQLIQMYEPDYVLKPK